jgi:TolB protein
LEKGTAGKPRQIFSAPTGAQASPTFSPDGNKIAFVSNKDGTARIYAISIPSPETPIKSIKPLLISKQNRDNTAPAWSPDGTKLAYSAMADGVRQIWIYDFLTQKETQLTRGLGNKENPSWAPNSAHLIFHSSTHQSSELFLMNLTEKEAIQISHGADEKRFPCWEPLF